MKGPRSTSSSPWSKKQWRDQGRPPLVPDQTNQWRDQGRPWANARPGHQTADSWHALIDHRLCRTSALHCEGPGWLSALYYAHIYFNMHACCVWRLHQATHQHKHTSVQLTEVGFSKEKFQVEIYPLFYAPQIVPISKMLNFHKSHHFNLLPQIKHTQPVWLQEFKNK